MNPFLSIWTKPQATLTYMIERKSIGFGMIVIALASLSSGVFLFADTGFLSNFSLPVILFISFFLSIALSIPFYFLNAAIYLGIGKLLGGKGKWREMCLATASGSLPMIGVLPVTLIALLIYGKSLYFEPVGTFAITNMSAGFYLFYILVSFGLSIYGVVILSKAVGYAHQFSALRGFGTVLIYMAIVFVVVFVIMVMLISGIFFLAF